MWEKDVGVLKMDQCYRLENECAHVQRIKIFVMSDKSKIVNVEDVGDVAQNVIDGRSSTLTTVDQWGVQCRGLQKLHQL